MSATTKSRHAVGRGRRHIRVRASDPVEFWRLRVVAFCVGGASLGAEIAAARLLAPYFGASTIIWANTIATVLVALSVGYAVGGRLADRRADMRGLCVIVLGASVLLAIVPFVSDPFLLEAVKALGALSVGGFFGSLAAVLVLVAVPVLLLGMVSPYANRLAVGRVADTGTVTGRLYAISTAGSLVGTFLAALLLIPLIGTHRTFLVFAAILAILGDAAGTVARAYGHYFPRTRVDAVEIDGELTAIGKRYFGLRGPDLHLYTADARPWLESSHAHYDAIFLDAYRQPYIPFYLVTREFFALIHSHLNPGGVVVVNVGHLPGSNALEKVVTATLHAVFPVVARDLQSDTNSLVVASTRPVSPEHMVADSPAGLVALADRVAGQMGPALQGGQVYTDDKAPVEWLTDLSILQYAIGKR